MIVRPSGSPSSFRSTKTVSFFVQHLQHSRCRLGEGAFNPPCELLEHRPSSVSGVPRLEVELANRGAQLSGECVALDRDLPAAQDPLCSLADRGERPQRRCNPSVKSGNNRDGHDGRTRETANERDLRPPQAPAAVRAVSGDEVVHAVEVVELRGAALVLCPEWGRRYEPGIPIPWPSSSSSMRRSRRTMRTATATAGHSERPHQRTGPPHVLPQPPGADRRLPAHPGTDTHGITEVVGCARQRVRAGAERVPAAVRASTQRSSLGLERAPRRSDRKAGDAPAGQPRDWSTADRGVPHMWPQRWFDASGVTRTRARC